MLTPFTVDTTKDRGYQAENTLSGSRLNSSLADTPASVSVFTKEFLQDVGLTELNELIDYSVNAQLNFNDTGPAIEANPYVNATSLTRKIDIRGIPSSQALDYFHSITPDDSYRVGRYDESRGPNGILFGISDVGGLINQTSKQAQTRRDAAMVRYSFGTEHRSRLEVEGNKVLREGQAGGAGRRPRSGERRVADARFPGQGADLWRRDVPADVEAFLQRHGRDRPRAARRRGAVHPGRRGARVVRQSPGPRAGRGDGGAAQRQPDGGAAGPRHHRPATRTSPTAGVRRITFINNNSTVFNAAGTYLTGSYNNPTVQHPDGSPGVTGRCCASTTSGSSRTR